MKWQVVIVGRPALAWARMAVEMYAERLRRMAQVEMVVVREGNPEQVAPRVIEASAGTWRVVLDERGRELSSAGLAQWIQRQELASLKRVSLIIGGADGHAETVRQAADELWRLSAMTLQHEMALVLGYEQLYRAYSMLRGEPYHRA